MSRRILSSEMEGIYGTLYELICPMLASDSCVKCITEDGGTTFTCDPEHLLRNVDIEHPAGELVLKTLQSHKHTFGTGTKTLLFMLTSLAKAIVQLCKLGIHSDDSLDVIRNVFTDLTKEVQEISIDTKESFHSSKQEHFSRKIKNCTYDNNCAYMSDVSDNHKSDGQLTADNKTEALNKPEYVLHQHAEEHCLLNTNSDIVHKSCSDEVGEEHCLLPEEKSCILYSTLTSMHADCPDVCHKPAFTSCTTKKYNSNAAKLDLDSVTCGSNSVAYPCSDREIVAADVTEMWGHEFIWKSYGEIQATQCPSTDTVLLKMSNLRDLSENVEDIDWFFDSTLSCLDSTKANSSLSEVHVSHDTTKSSDRFLNCLTSGHQGCRTCSFDSPQHETQWSRLDSPEKEIQCNGLYITLPFHNLNSLHSSELCNLDCKNHENELIANGGIHSLIDDEQHSSDFVSCFDECDKKHSFEVTNVISSGKLDNKMNVSVTESCLVSESNYFGSKLLSNLTHTAFNEDFKHVLANMQLSKTEEKDDEFISCFSDNDVRDSSVLCEKAVIKHLKDSDIPSSCHIARDQLSETYDDDDDDEFSACFSDINVQGSPVTCNNSLIKHVNDSRLTKYDEFSACLSDIDIQDSSVPCEHAEIKHVNRCEYPLPIHTLEYVSDIKQKHLFMKESSVLCDVKVTNSMSSDEIITGTFYEKGVKKDTVRTSGIESSDIVTHTSKIARLHSLLEIFRSKKSPVDFSKLSRHMNHFQSQSLQPQGPESNISANSKDILNENSSNLTGSIHCRGNLKDTFQDGSNLSSGISTYDMTTTLQAQRCYATCAVEIDPSRNSLYSEKTKSSDQRKTPSEVHDANRHKLISQNHDRQALLDELLLQKKATFRSTMAQKVMLSSRHFSKDSENNISFSSVFLNDSGLTECSPNVGNEYVSYSNPLETQNINADWADSKRKAEFDNIKDSNVLIHNESVAISESSNDRTGTCAPFGDHSVDIHTCTCSETSNTNCLQDSACCNAVEVLPSLSEEPKKLYSTNQHLEVVNCLHDCKSDIGDAAKYIFQNQLMDKADARFNLHLVNCLLLPSLVSMPKSFTSSWRSSTAPVSVTSGLIIPCDSHILEKLHMNGQSLVTLLIGGDLTSNFHHKGYVSTLSKRTIIAKPHDGRVESDERIWCASILNVINQLSVKLLLVKGKASSVLVDMCEGAGVLLLTSISYRTLNVLSYLHRVDIVTYLALATEANVCTIWLQPLSANWMDNIQDTQLTSASQFAVITGTPDVQTAIIHCSNTMSAQLLEERLWKCLHGLANSQADGCVLPGQGKTEIWCAKQIRDKYGLLLGHQTSVQGVVLDAVADIFHDYYQMVMLNIQFYAEEHIEKKNYAEMNPVSTTQCINYLGFLEQNCLSKIHDSPHETRAFFESQTNSDSFKTVTGNHMTQSVGIEPDIFESPDCNMLHSSCEDTFSDNFSAENHIYDNFRSKISAWKTAVDVVSVLQNLGSLIISGMDTVSTTESMTLL